MHPRNRNTKIRCLCLEIIAANETVFVSTVFIFLFSFQNPLIADCASEASDRQSYPVFGVNSPFHLSLGPLSL